MASTQADGPPEAERAQRVEVDGRTVRYHVEGDGLPVLFLHGWGLGHRAYRHSLARLVDLGCRVWAPSLPGFGGTAALADRQADLADYADWVAAFLDAVGVGEPVFLIGHSFGGGVAIGTAHRHPERVRTLVLVNSIGGAAWQEGDEPGALVPVRTLAERPLWDWGRHFTRDLFPLHLARRVLPAVVPDALANLARSPLGLWRAGLLAREADLLAELEDLKARRLPVVVLWGTRDGVIPRPAFDALCRAIGADGEVVDGSHSWLLADPDAFGEVITNAVQVAAMARAEEQAPPPGPQRWYHRVRARVRAALHPEQLAA
ncbi:MAG: alpha/beta fold hydrolase [Acidimicrobiales bacterium]|nr:alpha/beta fold hydrolase [Acidimicrobiales bacterium]